MTKQDWEPFLSAAAEQDFKSIIDWTGRQFGSAQAVAYRATIRAAVQALRRGPLVLTAKQRPELGPGLHTLNIGRRGQRSRHLLLYRPGKHPLIEILRILHSSMDIGRHLPEGDETGP